ncbi:MAG: alpha-amylase family glycosyl hydrolase [Verrucomicrobiota bacterium]
MSRQLASARWEGPSVGIVALASDWPTGIRPPLTLSPPARLVSLEQAHPSAWALRSGHWIAGGTVHFFLWRALCPDAASPVVAGDFNDWAQGDAARWTMSPVCFEGSDGFQLDVPLGEALPGESGAFKFRLPDGRWVEPPHDADNVVRDVFGNRNLTLNRRRTDRHVFRFRAADLDSSAAPARVVFETPELLELADVVAPDPLDVLEPPGPFGAFAAQGRTVFRVFAPRAKSVSVASTGSAFGRPIVRPLHLDLKPEGRGAWVGEVARDLTGADYTLSVDGRTTFDPWARRLASAGDGRIGVVSGPEDLEDPHDGFVPPAPEDLVLLEVHVRDLLGLAGAGPSAGFAELADWIRDDGAYLRSLGINALELLPCTDYERGGKHEYHWGYMPVTAFAPATAYAPQGASDATAADAFRRLVRECHRAGLAVIMDLVLNHFGSPNALAEVDRDYYFRTDPAGLLTNWSGCGNDVRAEAPLFRRLALASIEHWTGPLGCDGVRLDLAELLGVPLLREIEEVMRLRRPGKILIAEPWSFRGHVARELDGSTWTSWDDGYREFLPAYVRGHARASDLLHHVAGCGIRPSARLRYAQSHDDMAWIDRITVRPGVDGGEPSPEDVLRTRMMHAVLLCSAGVPMLASGQDFLHSKCGVSNTWRHPEHNRMRPERLERFRSEHEFVARLIRFRLSSAGRALRPRQVVSPGWMRVTHQTDGEAFVAEINADRSLGAARVLLACKPQGQPVALDLPHAGPWEPVVLSPQSDCAHAPGPAPRTGEGRVFLPPLACGVWSCPA